MGEFFFNIDHGYLEALIRGFKVNSLAQRWQNFEWKPEEGRVDIDLHRFYRMLFAIVWEAWGSPSRPIMAHYRPHRYTWKIFHFHTWRVNCVGLISSLIRSRIQSELFLLRCFHANTKLQISNLQHFKLIVLLDN